MLKDTLLYLAQNQRMRTFVIQNGATRRVSRRFVAGETLEQAIEAARVLNQRSISVALDYLGENVSDASEASDSKRNYLNALHLIKQTGIDANISVKLTALGLDISPALCEANLHEILEVAQEYKIFVCIDMEASEYTARTVDMVLLMHKKFPHVVGTVMQTYLFRCQKDVERLVAEGVRLRLVKGAYKEPPTVAYQQKKEGDRNYQQLMALLLAQGFFPAIATHDPEMLNAARTFVLEHGINKEAFEFQMLYGIRQDLQTKLRAEGYNMRVYLPYGSQWYPYLMRRMAERPANLLFVVSNMFR